MNYEYQKKLEDKQIKDLDKLIFSLEINFTKLIHTKEQIKQAHLFKEKKQKIHILKQSIEHERAKKRALDKKINNSIKHNRHLENQKFRKKVKQLKLENSVEKGYNIDKFFSWD